ncbi:MAG: PP2C family protein-serine/threonine phosphatase [Acidimicrobiales bacterium]
MSAPIEERPRRRAQSWAFSLAFIALLAGNAYIAWQAREEAIAAAGPGEEPDLTIAWTIAIAGGVAIVGLLLLLIITLRHQRRLRAINQELVENEARSRSLQEVTGRLARVLTSHEVVEALLDHLPAAVGAKAATVAVVDDGGELQVLAPDPAAEDTPVEPHPGSLVAGVLEVGEPAWLQSPLGWRGDGLADELAAEGWAMALLPLRADDVRGVLAVSYARVHTFVEEERALLETVAVLAARAFARGRRFDAEQRASLAFQRTALPAGLPSIDGLTVAARYRAGSVRAAVGGDWYDVFDLGDERAALLVGDVVGHGMEAAVAMGRLRTGFRMIAAIRREPGAMVQAVSRQVEAIPNAMCSTVLCAVVHLPTGTMDWCRAGHLPPMLVRGTKAVLLDEEGVPPLGVAPELRPPVHRLVLLPGDIVVLYTDGVIERRHESIDDGFDRLCVVGAELSDLEPDEMADALLEALVPLEEQTDDVAILIIRYDGRGVSAESG